MRILVTGSRDWEDEALLQEVLFEYLPGRGSEMHTVVLVHGDCPTGADYMAWLNWTANGGSDEPHPADWKTHGKKAGYLRNAEMVALGADVCLAFIRNKSRGASMTAALAEEAGIPVRRFEVTDG